MNSRRRNVLAAAGLALVAVWLGAWGGYRIALGSRMTAEKVAAYLASVSLEQLAGEDRARALRELVRRINALPAEERRRFRVGREWSDWFEAMTEEEKGWFIESTLPTGFQQMLTSFEQLPEPSRRKAIEDALNKLEETRTALAEEGDLVGGEGTNSPPELSEELRQKAIQLGLKAYYSGSSARTKAELAPLLEEIQAMMEGGRFLRRRRPHE